MHDIGSTGLLCHWFGCLSEQCYYQNICSTCSFCCSLKYLPWGLSFANQVHKFTWMLNVPITTLKPTYFISFCVSQKCIIVTPVFAGTVILLFSFTDSPEKIGEDYELQNWAKELAVPKEKGGVGLKVTPHSRAPHPPDPLPPRLS